MNNNLRDIPNICRIDGLQIVCLHYDLQISPSPKSQIPIDRNTIKIHEELTGGIHTD